MGDCAFVIFHSPENVEVSPAVYLHWHGGLALALLEASLPRLRTGHASYSCARFIGECHAVLAGNVNLGVDNIYKSYPSEKPQEAYCQHMAYLRGVQWGDRGAFIVDVDRWTVEHAGSTTNQYGDTGDGFGMQEETTLHSSGGIVQLPAEQAGN